MRPRRQTGGGPELKTLKLRARLSLAGEGSAVFVKMRGTRQIQGNQLRRTIQKVQGRLMEYLQ